MLRAAIPPLCLLVLACAAPTTLLDAYRPVAAAPREASVDTLSVRFAGDQRPLGGRTSIGTSFLIFFPLVPYGHQQIPPDRFTSDFGADVVNTVVADLRAAGVARSVLKEGDRLPGQAEPAAPHRLVLTLEEGTLHRKVTLYGLSIAGFFLWLFGAPVAYGNSDLAIGAELLDPSGQSLGRTSLQGDSGFAEGMYYNPFPPTATTKLGDAFAQISPELRRFVQDALEAPER
jgi:hypothetical protein